ncbi:MAG: hypothetical protein Q7S47_00095 [bacterium]|nr:hypothetical protein [bacterium]
MFNQTGVGSISLGRIGYGWSGGWYFPPTVQAAAGQHLAIIPKGTTKAFGLLADFSEIASTGSMTIALLSAPNSTESPLVNSTFTVARPRLTFTVSSDTPTSPIASNTVQVSLVRLIARSGEVPAPLYGLDFAVAFTEGMQTLNYRLTKGLMYIMIGDRQLSLAREGDGTYHVQFGYGATPLTTLEANSSVVFDLETDVGNATGSISASLTATAGNGIALATGSPIVQGPIRQITN